jgi:hypothetical protein
MWTITTEPERLCHSTRIVRTRAPSSHRGAAESPPYRKSAGYTIATSASRPDGTNYCLPLFARRPVPHRLRILALMAFGSGPHERCLWKTLRRASVHHGCPLLASALVPIFVGRDFSAGTDRSPSHQRAGEGRAGGILGESFDLRHDRILLSSE